MEGTISPERADTTVRGAVGILQRNGRFLLIRRAEGIRAGGCWCFPGGAIESGETSAQAIVREMAEEVGLRVRAIEQVWQSSREAEGETLVLDWWRVKTTGGRLQPNPAEVAEVRWLAAEEIRNHPSVLPGLQEFLDRFGASSHEGD